MMTTRTNSSGDGEVHPWKKNGHNDEHRNSEKNTLDDDSSEVMELLESPFRRYMRKKKLAKTLPKLQVLEPEQEEGHVEYKREIMNPSYARKVGLTTQMSFRLDQGQGLAMYMLGVEDDGAHSLNSTDEIRVSIENLTGIALGLGAQITKVSIISLMDDIRISELAKRDAYAFRDNASDIGLQIDNIARAMVTVHHVDVSGQLGIDHDQTFDACSAPNNFLILGPGGAGKSTLIGSLVSDNLDNGLGYSRCCVLRHRHEFNDCNRGQSSCVGRFWLESSQGKHVVLTDTPGNEKYLKQTLAAATLAVDYALLLVDCTRLNDTDYILDISRYLSLVQNHFMNKRVLILANKYDLVDESVDLNNLFCGYKSLSLSCVTGHNMRRLKAILFNIPKRLSKHKERLNEPFEFLVTATHTNIADDMQIVEGYVRSGSIDLSESLHVFKSDSNIEVSVQSIQINHKNMNKVSAGQFCSLGLKTVDSKHQFNVNQLKILTRNGSPRTDKFCCQIHFLSTLKKPYNNANVQLIYLNMRYTATLFTLDDGCDIKSGCSDCSEDEDRETDTEISLVECEVIVDTGVTLLADGARFYICDFSQILGALPIAMGVGMDIPIYTGTQDSDGKPDESSRGKETPSNIKPSITKYEEML